MRALYFLLNERSLISKRVRKNDSDEGKTIKPNLET